MPGLKNNAPSTGLTSRVTAVLPKPHPPKPNKTELVSMVTAIICYTLLMKFEWDNQKAERNKIKHGIGFEEAETVFSDPLAVIFNDEWHSTTEEREIIIGLSNDDRLLLVCFTERTGGIRLISAREVTKKERQDYEENV